MQRIQLNMVVGLLLVGISTIGSLGCSRVERGSQLTIELPTTIAAPENARHFKVGGSGWSLQASEAPRAQSVLPIKFVAVNISGSDIKGRLYKAWESDAGSTNPVISFEAVPKGSNRLVQVIAAAEGSEGLVMYYGDSVIQVDRDMVDAPPVQLVHIGDSTQGEADIAGRILRADGTGPNGTLNVLFRPPNDRPPMLLFRLDIIAGWFESMLATSNSFAYVLEETGENLWTSISKDSSAFYLPAQPGRNMKIQVPVAYRPDWNNQAGPRERMEKRTIVAGFFGDPLGTDGKKVCYSKTTEDLQDVYVADNPSTVKVQWKDLPNMNLGTEAGVLTGGLDKNGAICLSKTDYVDRLIFDHQQIRNRDHVLGFSGPFRRIDAADPKLFDYSWASDQLTVTWKYLPGVISQSAIAGVEIFRRNRDVNDDHDLYGGPGGIQCGKLPFLGFTRLGAVTIPTESYVVSGVSNADYSNKNIQVVLCPYRETAVGRKFLNSGALVRMDGGGNGNGNGNPPAVKVVAYSVDHIETTAAARANVDTLSCYPFQVKALDAQNNMGSVDNQTLTIVAPTGNDFIYRNKDCSDPAAPSSSLIDTGFYGNNTYYFKTVRTLGGGTANIDVTVTSSATGVASGALHTLAKTQIAVADMIHTKAENSLVAHQCYPIEFLTKKTTTATHIGSAHTFTYPGSSDLQFFDSWNHDCTGASIATGGGSLPFSAYQVHFPARFKYVGSASTLSLAPGAANIAPMSGTAATKSVSVTQPGALAKIDMRFSSNFSAGACQQVRILSLDANNYLTPIAAGDLASSSNLSINLTASNGNFYSTPGCTGGSTTSALIPQSSMSTEVYYKPTSTGTHTLSATTTNRAGGFVSSISANAQVGPAVAESVLMLLPGQQISAGSINGQSWPIFKGYDHSISLYAVTPFGAYDTGFNLNSGGFGFFPGGVSYTVTSEPAWSSGVASGAGAMRVNFSSIGSSTLQTGGTNGLGYSYNSVRLIAPAQISIYTTSSFSSGACQPFLFIADDGASGTAVPRPSISTAITSFSDSNGMLTGLYSTSTCSGGYPLISADHSAGIGYVSAGTFGSIPNVSLNNDQGLSLASSTVTGTVGSAAPTSPTIWQIIGTSSFYAGACQPFMAIAVDVNGNSGAMAGPVSASVTTDDANGRFFSDGRCDGAGAASETLNYTSGDRANLFYYRGVSSGTLSVTGGGFSTGTLGVSPY